MIARRIIVKIFGAMKRLWRGEVCLPKQQWGTATVLREPEFLASLPFSKKHRTSKTADNSTAVVFPF